MVGRFSSRGRGSSYGSGGRSRWIVPLVTFVLGALLGGLGIGLLMRGGDEPAPVIAPPTTASPTTVSDRVAVPRACLQIAGQAQVLQGQVDQALQAARDLDAAGLAEMVRGIDEQQNALRRSTDICRQGAATATPVTDPATVTSTVTVPPEPASTAPAPQETTPATPATPGTARTTPAPATATG